MPKCQASHCLRLPPPPPGQGNVLAVQFQPAEIVESHYRQTATVTVVQMYITILYRVSLQPLSLWWHLLQSYTTVTSLTMTPDVYLKVGTTSYRATCWYKNLSYSDMSLFYQKQYLSFLMISISATCRNMRGYTVLSNAAYMPNFYETSSCYMALLPGPCKAGTLAGGIRSPMGGLWPHESVLRPPVIETVKMVSQIR